MLTYAHCSTQEIMIMTMNLLLLIIDDILHTSGKHRAVVVELCNLTFTQQQCNNVRDDDLCLLTYYNTYYQYR